MTGFFSRTARCAVLALISLPFFAGAQEGNAADAVLSRLLDTGVPSAGPLSVLDVAKRDGWTILEEEDLEHSFRGDAVLLNDKLAVILRQNGQGAEVYTLSGFAPSLRSTLAPNTAQRIASLRIVENTPAAVAVQATFASENGQASAVTYRVTVGQIIVQMEPEGADALRVSAQTDYVVAPDFFADDLVYGAQTTTAPWAGLPAENFFLHLSGGGSTIITCVWESNDRNARVLFSGEGEARSIAGSEIECAPGKPIWAAFADRPGSWHTATLPRSQDEGDVALNWTPPFPAKWRGNFVSTGEQALSWNFVDARAADYVAPGLGKMTYPCWFEGGASFVSLPKTGALTDPARTGVPLVIYPIDRSQATPLDVFVLVDIMRGTLGVGPCQYVLDLEGLDAASSPTPALVLEWVEKLFKKRRADKSEDAIREKLAAMEAHIEHADRRIDAYTAFATKLRDLAGAGTPEQVILSELETTVRDLSPARESPLRVKELSERVASLVGREDWEAVFEPARDELCAIGAAQDRTLSKCRMALRRVKQHCLAEASADPKAAEMAQQIDGMLREST